MIFAPSDKLPQVLNHQPRCYNENSKQNLCYTCLKASNWLKNVQINYFRIVCDVARWKYKMLKIGTSKNSKKLSIIVGRSDVVLTPKSKTISKSFKIPSSISTSIKGPWTLQINFTELSPNYAGTLMGISNGVATICGFVAPMVAGYITNDNVGLVILTYISPVVLILV